MSEEEVLKTATPVDHHPGTSTHTTAEILASFYSDRKLMWRNVSWITFGQFGMAISMTILVPLMNLRIKAVGISDSGVGLLTSVNLWAVSFLVMYFSWKSDHCTSRLGRRTPFVLISLPFITVALMLFPLFSEKWVLVGLMLVYYFFNDMTASTYPLLSIDCVSKEVLARVSGLLAVVISLAGFLSARYGAKMADEHETGVFFVAAGIMAATVLLALWRIREPPIRHPAEGTFNLLAPVRIACRDKRILILMVAIALLNASAMIFKTWVWFYGTTKLGLTIGDTGAALSWGLLLKIVVSYPAGWVIDRFGSYVALCVEWLLMLVLAVSSIYVASSGGLVLLMVLFSLFMSLEVAGDTILWKIMDKADTGSFTSTVALIRNFCTGTVIAVSGYLIKWTGSYIVAFWFGFALCTVALIGFFVYRSRMRSGGESRVLHPAVIDPGELGEPGVSACAAVRA